MKTFAVPILMSMCGFIVQLVEHRTGIAKVTGSKLKFESRFRIVKNFVLGTENWSAIIFGQAIRPKVFGKWQKNP